MMQTTTKVATALLALTNAVFFVSANYPVVRYKNGTVAVLNEGGEVRVKSDEFVVYGNLSISGNLTVNGTNVGALDANITAVKANLEIFCDEDISGNLPSSLTHWFDFSDKQVTYSTVNAKVKVSGFVDKIGNATSLAINGVVEFKAGVAKKGKDTIYVNTDKSGLEFKTSKLGRNPEVFVVYNHISYMGAGVLLGENNNGYHFGTYGAGDGNIGVGNTAGQVMAKTNATYGDWHVADVYYGDSNGFISIDSDINTGSSSTPNNNVSFGINGQYTAQTHTYPVIGGWKGWINHYSHAYIGEVMYFNQKLTDYERYRVKRYLYNKWVEDICTEYSTSTKMEELEAAISKMMAPKCMEPGGLKLYYNGTDFECTCAEGYYGPACTPPPLDPIPNSDFNTFVGECLSESTAAAETGECTTWALGNNYGTMPNWDTSLVLDMSNTFNGKTTFNGDISKWDTSQVVSMSGLFAYSAFNQPIGSWDTSQVLDMQYLFVGDHVFNQPIGSWDVSQVVSMYGVFFSASAFNQPIGSWDVSQVTTMTSMFYFASVFNQNISKWDVSRVTDMKSMFALAKAFNQDISSWTGTAANTVQTEIFYQANAFQAKYACADAETGPLSSCIIKSTWVAPPPPPLSSN